MNLSLNDLNVDHLKHDQFIRKYLSCSHDEDSDVVLKELKKCSNNGVLAKFVIDKLETLCDFNQRNIHYLALYLLLQNYSEKWEFMFESTYKLLCDILKVIKGTYLDIYPPKWTKCVFRLENIMTPNELRGVIFGIDPISDKYKIRIFATGHAFTFDVPEDKLLYIASSKGLACYYGLDQTKVSLLDSNSVETNFIQKYSIGIINMIRTIFAGSQAGSKNSFKEAWFSYHYDWLQGLPEVVVNNVLIFQNERFPFHNMSKSETFQNINRLLVNATRCTHPSHIISISGIFPCLRDPPTELVIVDKFIRFIYNCNSKALESFNCPSCSSKNLKCNFLEFK